ncbi:MAG: hypothetical protein IPI73_19655 [Betaproteobacteria bacterium]|nr:hypothetical protein [Betaproteobacteria bacterium]
MQDMVRDQRIGQPARRAEVAFPRPRRPGIEVAAVGGGRDVHAAGRRHADDGLGDDAVLERRFGKVVGVVDQDRAIALGGIGQVEDVLRERRLAAQRAGEAELRLGGQVVDDLEHRGAFRPAARLAGQHVHRRRQVAGRLPRCQRVDAVGERADLLAGAGVAERRADRIGPVRDVALGDVDLIGRGLALVVDKAYVRQRGDSFQLRRGDARADGFEARRGEEHLGARRAQRRHHRGERHAVDQVDIDRQPAGVVRRRPGEPRQLRQARLRARAVDSEQDLRIDFPLRGRARVLCRHHQGDLRARPRPDALQCARLPGGGTQRAEQQRQRQQRRHGRPPPAPAARGGSACWGIHCRLALHVRSGLSPTRGRCPICCPGCVLRRRAALPTGPVLPALDAAMRIAEADARRRAVAGSGAGAASSEQYWAAP